MLQNRALGSDFQNHVHHQMGMIEIDEKRWRRQVHPCPDFLSGELDIVMYPMLK